MKLSQGALRSPEPEPSAAQATYSLEFHVSTLFSCLLLLNTFLIGLVRGLVDKISSFEIQGTQAYSLFSKCKPYIV